MSAISVGALSAIATKKAIENTVNDIYNSAKGGVKGEIDKWRARSKIDKLYLKLRQVRMVKTIWQSDKAVDLLRFYYPTRVDINDTQVAVASLERLPRGNLILEGTVGQGKSILLRYLAAAEVTAGRRVPLFCELRRFDPSVGVEDWLCKELSALGLNGTLPVLEYLAESSRLVLLLDGFDEVKDENREAAVEALEYLSRRFEDLQVVVTSRPESSLAMSPYFEIVKLCELEGDEYKSVIHKIADDPKVADAIVEGVRGHDIRELLTTPLMISLLVFRYRIDQSMPSNATAFYDDLFDLLLLKHDKTKPGFDRKRSCGLNDPDIRTLFDSFCFLTAQENLLEFERPKIRSLVRVAAKRSEIVVNPDALADDLSKIVCLVLHEAGTFKFIHKSVQEFHAASFIKEQPESVAESFYQSCLEKGPDLGQTWRQVIRFLEQIDPHRFKKHLAIPVLEAFLGSMRSESDERVAGAILESVEVAANGRGMRFGARNMTFAIFPRLHAQAYDALFVPKWIRDVLKSTPTQSEDEMRKVRFHQADKLPLSKTALKEVRLVASQIAEAARKLLSQYERDVQSAEERDSFIRLP